MAATLSEKDGVYAATNGTDSNDGHASDDLSAQPLTDDIDPKEERAFVSFIFLSSQSLN